MILGVEIFLIFLAVVFIDSRLHKIRKIESEVLKELQLVNGSQREIVKALQWMVDNWKQDDSKPPDQPPPV